MIVVFKHEDVSKVHQGIFYENFSSFIIQKFKIDITEDGSIAIDGNLQKMSYKIGQGANDYTIPEAKKHFTQSKAMKEYARAHFYTAYEIAKKII
jgi:hypothetical protein